MSGLEEILAKKRLIAETVKLGGATAIQSPESLPMEELDLLSRYKMREAAVALLVSGDSEDEDASSDVMLQASATTRSGIIVIFVPTDVTAAFSNLSQEDRELLAIAVCDDFAKEHELSGQQSHDMGLTVIQTRLAAGHLV